MRAFRYVRAADPAAALHSASSPGAAFIGGGTTLIDLMKLGVEAPDTLVDVNHLDAGAPIQELPDGGLRISATARNSDVAHHALVRERFPVLSEALLAGASPQVRNMATVGGNLAQRTRCAYFRDAAVGECNKRAPGSGCAAQDGWTRMHAVLGGSRRCIAAHPSDMCVALVALDAIVHTQGPKGARQIPIADFHTLPAEHPEIETALEHGELITGVALPAAPFAARSGYVKVRDRAAFAFALASAAVAVDLHGGRMRAVRVALGGVATKPWRSHEAEALLVGQAPRRSTFEHAAAAAVRGAEMRPDNEFKVKLAQRTLVRALETVVGR
jgi:xanthine dehydrogenase YagS FAD-binding subunit